MIADDDLLIGERVLVALLSEGPIPTRDVEAVLDALGFGSSQQRRLRYRTGVKAHKVGGRSEDTHWELSLPPTFCVHCGTRFNSEGVWPASANGDRTDAFDEAEPEQATSSPEPPPPSPEIRTPRREPASVGTTCSTCGRQSVMPRGQQCFHIVHGERCTGVMR